jgi:hypothetical protein
LGGVSILLNHGLATHWHRAKLCDAAISRNTALPNPTEEFQKDAAEAVNMQLGRKLKRRAALCASRRSQTLKSYRPRTPLPLAWWRLRGHLKHLLLDLGDFRFECAIADVAT